MRRTFLLLAILTTAAPAASAGQSALRRLDGTLIAPPAIDSTVTSLMRAADVTGVGITLFDRGQVAYQKTYGVRDKEKDLALTTETVTSAASLTKATFAYMVMQLVEEKILDLDRPVQSYLPKPLAEYPRYLDLAADPRYRRITTRMLLDHTSGFPNFRVLNEDLKLNINFDPGSRFAYSGEGMQLLQFVIETITNKPLGELMQERVFRPLGMTRTSMVWDPAFEDDHANGYDAYGRSLGPQRFPQADAAGSMLTTLADFSRLIQAVMQSRGLRKSTRDLMLSPQIPITSQHEFPTLAAESTDVNKAIQLSYGLGWGLYRTPYGKAFFKEGHAEGFRNYAVCFGNGTGIVILTNSANGEGIYKGLLETLLRNTYTPIEWEGFTPFDQLPPRPPLKQHREIMVAPATLDKYVGSYGVSTGLALKVTREGNRLMIWKGAERHEMVPEGDRDFFSQTADDEVKFRVDAQGRVTEMVLSTSGRSMVIKRIFEGH